MATRGADVDVLPSADALMQAAAERFVHCAAAADLKGR